MSDCSVAILPCEGTVHGDNTFAEEYKTQNNGTIATNLQVYANVILNRLRFWLQEHAFPKPISHP